MIAAVILAGCTACIPPIGRHHKVSQHGGEAAIYATAAGKTKLLEEGHVGGPNSHYPVIAFRLNEEGDVHVACSAPAKCEVARESESPRFTPPALNLAIALAGPRSSYPFDVVISFRILAIPQMYLHWAPLACPKPNDSSPENERLKSNLNLTGRCDAD
jgi:hypothetical protein